MEKFLSISRAAKLVGISRGALQKKIHDNELTSFEGQVSIDDIERIFPDAELEDNHLLEDLERIIESSLKKARGEKLAKLLMPDVHTLSSRLSNINAELVKIKKENQGYKNIFNQLQQKLELESSTDNEKLKSYLKSFENWLSNELVSLNQSVPRPSNISRKDMILSVISAQVRLMPSGHEFFIEGNTNILEAGLSAGLAMNYGCSNGNCGKCKAKLISGEIKKTKPHDYVFTEAEKNQNYFLCCSNTARSDIEIEAIEAGSAEDIPLQHIQAKIKKINKINDDIIILNIKTPRTSRLRFLAGQHVSISKDNLSPLTVPIASCPCDDMNLQFHIQKNDTHPMNNYIFNDATASDSITLNGPGGEFILNESSMLPVLFIAFDTGFAPVKSLIEQSLTLEHAEYNHLLWLHTSETAYMKNQCRAWEDAFDNFNYTTAQYKPNAYQTVKQSINELSMQYQDLRQFDIYICGTENIVEETTAILNKKNIDTSRIYVKYL